MSSCGGAGSLKGPCLSGCPVAAGHRELGAIAAAEILDGEGPSSAADSELIRLCGGVPAAVDAEMVIRAARNGDKAALDVLDVVTARTARVIAVVATLFDPRLVVLSGGPARAGDMLIPLIDKKLGGLDRHTRLVASALTDQATLRGAVRVALHHAFTSVLV